MVLVFFLDNVGFCVQFIDNIKVNFVLFKFYVVLFIIKINIFVVILQEVIQRFLFNKVQEYESSVLFFVVFFGQYYMIFVLGSRLVSGSLERRFLLKDFFIELLFIRVGYLC